MTKHTPAFRPLLLALAVAAAPAASAQQSAPVPGKDAGTQPPPPTSTEGEGRLGSLVCAREEGKGYNLLITSKSQVRCVFADKQGAEQWYLGETGVGIGVDLKWNKAQKIRYGILSSTTTFTPEGDFLNGKYGGAKAEVAAGVGLGAGVLLGGSNDTFSLQPSLETSKGVGVAAGVSYLNLDSDPLSLARVATPTGGVASQALYSGYFNQGLTYYRSALYSGSDRFSGKAVDAAAAKTVRPEDLPEGVPDEDAAALAESRKRLVAALNEPLSFEAPADLAIAQVNFDCWAWGLANEAPKVQVNGCRNAHLNAIGHVEAAVAEARVRRDRLARLLQPRWFTVYFGTDRHELEPFAQKAIADAVASLGDLEDARVFIGGNTDRTGTSAYNAELSEKRALAVRAALVAAGVPEAWLTLGSYGDTNPARIGANPHDAFNRRVDITIQPVTVKQEALASG